MNISVWWVLGACTMPALLCLAACARLPAANLASLSSATADAILREDTEVITARQTIEHALLNPVAPMLTATPLPPTVIAASDWGATATSEAQQLATVVAATLTAQPTATNVALLPAGAEAKNLVDDATIIYIPAGEFTMGMTDEQINSLVSICTDCKRSDFVPSQPVHQVDVSSFWIYKTEITNHMYAQCVNAGICRPPVQTKSETRSDYWSNSMYADYPVIFVDWFSAEQYCRWAGGRLPTEAEWEKAARGSDERLFPWGNTPPDATLANTKGLVGNTTPVGSYPRGESVYGVQDMAGNVWEWVADWYESDYYTFSDYENPLGPVTSRNRQRSGRGGSWYWAGAYASAAYHDWWEPEQSGSGVGFRCVIDTTRMSR